MCAEFILVVCVIQLKYAYVVPDASLHFVICAHLLQKRFVTCPLNLEVNLKKKNNSLARSPLRDVFVLSSPAFLSFGKCGIPLSS